MTRILMVEDDQDIRELIAARLRHAGHGVRAVADADAALEVMRSDVQPELLVLDVGLPGMDGLELLQQLRTDERHRETPAIFLSARVQEQDIERGRVLGAEYLTKPFVANALLTRVDEVMRRVAAAAAADW